MARMVCRLKYHKGQPLSLSIYPGPTFMSLSFDIRQKIYQLLLVSSEPIIVNREPPSMNSHFNDSTPITESWGRLTSVYHLTL